MCMHVCTQDGVQGSVRARLQHVEQVRGFVTRCECEWVGSVYVSLHVSMYVFVYVSICASMNVYAFLAGFCR